MVKVATRILPAMLASACLAALTGPAVAAARVPHKIVPPRAGYSWSFNNCFWNYDARATAPT